MLLRRFPTGCWVPNLWIYSKKTEPCCSMAAEASRVLDDDNLLGEILVRVSFPTTLVCAALVCKRWYRHASDPAFLRRFRKLNPPRLLGFYLDYGPYSVPATPCFVPMPLQAPELAAVVRRVSSYSFSHRDLVCIENCQNGTISTSLFSYKSGRSEGMHSPLCAERDTLLPHPRIKDQDRFYYQVLAGERDDGSLSHFYVCMKFARGTTDYTVQAYALQDGDWRASILRPRQSSLFVYGVNRKLSWSTIKFMCWLT